MATWWMTLRPCRTANPERMITDLCARCRGLMLDDRVVVGGAHPCPYKLRDSLPDFPVLRESWSQGCPCCGFIRGLFLSKKTAQVLDEVLGKRDLARVGVVISIEYILTKAYTSNQYSWLRISLTEALNPYAAPVNVWCLLETDGTLCEQAYWLPLLRPQSEQSYIAESSVTWLRERLAERDCHDHQQRDDGFLPALLVDVRRQPKLVMRTDAESARRSDPALARMDKLKS